jgi:hypothetical protein
MTLNANNIDSALRRVLTSPNLPAGFSARVMQRIRLETKPADRAALAHAELARASALRRELARNSRIAALQLIGWIIAAAIATIWLLHFAAGFGHRPVSLGLHLGAWFAPAVCLAGIASAYIAYLRDNRTR